MPLPADDALEPPDESSSQPPLVVPGPLRVAAASPGAGDGGRPPGPTNSGKSHDAMARLAEVGAGTYAAPLRLLAREAYERLAPLRPAGEVGLVTGEERLHPGAPIICCTTELAPRRGEVLVLDEVHWVDDPDRGWAWGRLLAGAGYRHIRLVGAPNVERLLRGRLRRAPGGPAPSTPRRRSTGAGRWTWPPCPRARWSWRSPAGR